MIYRKFAGHSRRSKPDNDAMTTSQDEQTPWLFVWGGIVALAITMGIGRFAFTPLLPLMLRDGTIDEPTGV